MPDYPTPNSTASTPEQTFSRVHHGPPAVDLPDELRPDPADVAQLLAILDTIPRDDLPDGKARDALAFAIGMGHVDNLYQPLGADYWNISWGDLPPHMDPRQRVTDWVESVRLVTADIARLGGDA